MCSDEQQDLQLNDNTSLTRSRDLQLNDHTCLQGCQRSHADLRAVHTQDGAPLRWLG